MKQIKLKYPKFIKKERISSRRQNAEIENELRQHVLAKKHLHAVEPQGREKIKQFRITSVIEAWIPTFQENDGLVLHPGLVFYSKLEFEGNDQTIGQEIRVPLMRNLEIDDPITRDISFRRLNPNKKLNSNKRFYNEQAPVITNTR